MKCQSWWSTSWESRLLGEISVTSDMQMTPPLWQKARRNWRTAWWKWKRRVKSLPWNSTLKKNTKFMASGPITSWQVDWETMESVSDFIFLVSKITADGDCRHEIKRPLLLGRKAKTNLDTILKSRDIALPTKIHLVETMVSPIIMYGCESWTMKKAEC